MSANVVFDPEVQKSTSVMTVLRSLAIVDRVLPDNMVTWRAMGYILETDGKGDTNRLDIITNDVMFVLANLADAIIILRVKRGEVVAAMHVVKALVALLDYEADPNECAHTIKTNINLAIRAIDQTA